MRLTREEVANRPRPCHFQGRGTVELSRLGDYRCLRVVESVVRTDLILDTLVLDWNNYRQWTDLLRLLGEACPRRDPCAACGTPCVHLKVIEKDRLGAVLILGRRELVWKPNERTGSWELVSGEASSYFENTDTVNREQVVSVRSCDL